MRSSRTFILLICAMVGATLLIPFDAVARDVFVVTGDLNDDGQAIRGQGVLRQRLGSCMVITPWHVVESYNQGAPVHVIGLNGRLHAAHLKRQLEQDLAILEVVDGAALCDRHQMSVPENLDAILDGWAPMRLRLRQQNGDRLQFPVSVQTFNDEFVDFEALGDGTIEEGYSGGVVEAQDGVLAMLLRVEGQVAHALRWDALERAVASFFVEMEDVDLSCADSAPWIRVDVPTKVSELLARWPVADPAAGWSVSNIAGRLRSAPRLVISSRLEVDTEATLPACSVALAPSGQLVAPAAGAIKLVTLLFENQGGEVVSTGSPGPPAASVTGAGPAGRGHSRGGRKGCGGTKHGARGGPGQDGFPGGDGEEAGSLYLAAFKTAGPFRVSLVGGDGTTGGTGGMGGPGGNGAGATSGSSSAFDCKCGGNPGGRGGDGGPGGRGGRGGNGGDGGEVTLLVTAAVDPASVFKLEGGAPGGPGVGGLGGNPGGGGNKSGGTGFCSGQRGGSDGNRGPSGAPGQPGTAGAGPQPTVRVERTATGRPDLEAFFYGVLGEARLGLSP